MLRVLVRKKPDRKNLLLYFVSPLTGREESKSAATDDPREAERAAATWEAELRSKYVPSQIGWDSFRGRFEDEHLAGLSRKSRLSYGTALNHFERLIGKPTELAAVSASTISELCGAMRKENMPETTIATYLGHLRAAFRWAASIGILSSAPTIKTPKINKRRLSRGRPITEKEFKVFLAAVPSVVGADHAPEWTRMIRGLWLCGLRLEEALRLSWSSPPAKVELDSGRFPRILWYSEGHKARRDTVTPMTPDFAEFLRKTKAKDRSGPVFRPTYPGCRISPKFASKIISLIGKASEIKVNDDGKFASAHDLRRSFGTRWALKVRPITLKSLMRHASIETTLRYYVDLDCEDVGAELWGIPLMSDVPDNCPEIRKCSPEAAVNYA